MNKGDVIRIEYVGRLESGEIFDLTDEALAKKENIFNPKARYGSVPVVVGAGFVLPGLDRELEKMQVGEEKDIIVEPQDAFGNRRADMIKTLPMKPFREEPKPGMVIDFGSSMGRVQSVSGGRVRVDFNNPLAGKRLMYKIRITENVEGQDNKIKAVMEFFHLSADNMEIGSKAARIYASGPRDAKSKCAETIMRWLGIDSVEFVERFEKKPPVLPQA